ncbi:MAG: helix-turn-helix domain-containing protein [Pirellulaceae bacterium]
MQVRTKLTPPLNRFVDCLWHSEGYSPAHDLERALPTGTVEMVFRLEQPELRIVDDDGAPLGRFGDAVVSGTHSRYFVLETRQQSSVMGVHFRPGGAAPLLGLPLSELTDRHVGLADLWGRTARLWREQLLAARAPQARFDVLERLLLRRLAPPSTESAVVDDALARFTAAPSLARVRDVCAASGLSAKRFIRRFHDRVGLTPKLYCRVQRFQAVVDQAANRRGVDWARVALDCGYYDQSHLIRDFREFSGVTPAEYRPVEPDRKNHLAVSRDR